MPHHVYFKKNLEKHEVFNDVLSPLSTARIIGTLPMLSTFSSNLYEAYEKNDGDTFVNCCQFHRRKNRYNSF